MQEKGFTVIVLEAQEKVGGRMRTDRSLGVAFDEGASWIHGPNGNPITSLASQSGANTYLTIDGYATLAMYLKSRHKIHSFSAWCGISDLTTWYWQSVERNNKYASDINKCTDAGET